MCVVMYTYIFNGEKKENFSAQWPAYVCRIDCFQQMLIARKLLICTPENRLYFD